MYFSPPYGGEKYISKVNKNAFIHSQKIPALEIFS